MSTYVYMKILESAPRRYDLGLRILSLGRVTIMYDAAAEAAVAGQPAPRVLEIGCGTGNLTRRLAERGAIVTAIDINPDMLAVAHAKLSDLSPTVELREMAAVEIADRFTAGSVDAVAATLALSEMSEEEQAYVLDAAYRVLRPGGRLVVADEVRPSGLAARIVHALVRWPLAWVTYLVTQTSTAAVRNLAGLVRGAGFRVVEERKLPGGSGMIVGERPLEAA
ncbi:MAG: corrinoid protein-associated methyltransferase CpaM [Candidatus Binatia bacterium]